MIFKKDGAEFYGEMAEILGSISQKDWAFYEYRNKVMDQIFKVMEKSNIKKSDLAKMLGKSRSFVTQVFSEDHNMTLKTFCDILYVLDVRAETRIVAKSDDVMWEVHIVDRNKYEFTKFRKQIRDAYSNFGKMEDVNSVNNFRESRQDCVAGGVA